MIKVVIDPGHGGNPPPAETGGSSWNNASGPGGLLEKTVTLAVGLAARTALAAVAGVEVKLTRSTDVNLGIVKRAKVARDLGAAAFVSIHFNAAQAGQPPAQGTETWVGSAATQKSKDLATAVQKAVRAATGHNDRGVKIGDVSGVIANANHAAETAHCLVEISFLDRQPAEEARLADAAYITRLGQAVARGVEDYLRAAGLLGVGGEAVARPARAEDAASFVAAGGVWELLVETAGPSVTLASSAFSIGQPDQLPAPPFIVKPGEPDYSELGDRGSIRDPAAAGIGFRAVMEATVGNWNTVHAALLGVLGNSRRAVCRIVAPPGHRDYTDVVRAGWYGTGFLVAPDILLTNHHVLNSPEVAAAALAQFGYEHDAEALADGQARKEPPARGFRLRPDLLFLTSRVENGLDYTFVGIDPLAAKEFGTIKMHRGSLTLNRDDPVFVIHHPDGKPKQASLDDTEVVGLHSATVHYAADTQGGSSGAPVFNRYGRLCALHHAAVAFSGTLTDGRPIEVANEGVKLSAITIDLENRVRSGGSDGMAAERVLGHVAGSDTMSGYFGALGQAPPGESAAEVVVNTYAGTDADIDIGFWNIEWLSREYTDSVRLDAAASVIVDLNLDLWGLSEVSPNAMKALVERLKDRFRLDLRFALSEPNAGDHKQTTAVLWNPRVLEGGSASWPAEIDAWWRLDSRDRLPATEAVEGKIFDRYPGLFRFGVLGRDGLAPFDFHFVPLHLKAKSEGSKRRRLASILLGRAIRKMVDLGHDRDWIVGGDMNAELKTGDLEPLRQADMTPVSAKDEADGAFTYIASPNSLIDHIYLSPGLSSAFGEDDFFIVARDRTMDGFLKNASDHRPIALRLSLQDRGSAAPGEHDVIAIADRITRRAPPQPVVPPDPAAAAKPAAATAPRNRAPRTSNRRTA